MQSTPTPRRYAMPRLAVPERRVGIPVAATLAPVAVSLVLWAVTQSVFALMFALLGPVVALAGILDGRVRRRRQARGDLRAAMDGVDRLRERIADDLDAECGRLELLGPPATVLAGALAESTGVQVAWASDQEPLLVRLGRGTLPSRIALDHDPDAVPHPALEEAFAELESATRVVVDAPVLADPAGGIEIVGPEIIARPVARGVALQLCALMSPTATRVMAPSAESWILSGPHEVIPSTRNAFEFLSAAQPAGSGSGPGSHRSGSSILVTWATSPAEMRGAGGTTIRIDPSGQEVRMSSPDGEVESVHLEPLTSVEARSASRALHTRARHLGLLPVAARLPARVDLATLLAGWEPRPDDAADGEDEPAVGLAAPIGHDGVAPVTVDLVRDGPHAVVGGTTGSGKSELLVSWVLAMADLHPPDRVTFLLIDFKGGASFAALVGLPHVVGLLSDLDVTTARRATRSLRAEILRRERLLARAGARAIDELPSGALARLVIVVDEFAALVAEQPDLHDLVGDLAARGRSLGLHLVLCTQRPGGIVREAVLANATLRVSLRVNNRADSTALIGSAHAADLPADTRGRAIVVVEGVPRAFQVALASTEIADRLRSTKTTTATAPRPWADPLPARVRLSELRAADGPPGFCLLDDPDAQEIRIDAHDPGRDGCVLVVGGAGSGTTTAAAALAVASRRAVAWLPAHAGDAWAVLRQIVDDPSPHPAAPDRMLVADDLDLLLDRLGEEYRAEAVQLLARLVRESAARRLLVVASVKRVPAGASALLGSFGSRLILGTPSRDEHVLAGGAGQQWRAGRGRGSGIWRGHEVQVGVPDRLPRVAGSTVPIHRFRPHTTTAVVTTRPGPLGRELSRSGVEILDVEESRRHPETADVRRITGDGTARAILGDPDAWQGSWTLLGRLRQDADLLVDRCTAADLRSITRAREMPPPLDEARGECWLVRGREVARVRLEPPRDVHVS